MRVKEIMDTKHPSIQKHELATKARALIRNLGLRILPVTDENVKLLGKVSRRDVMAVSSSVSPIRVEGIMTPVKHIATVEDEVYSTIKQMLQADVWYAPVVSNSNEKIYTGVLGLEHFIEQLIKTNPEKFLKEVSEVMTKNVLSCSPDDEVDNIWRLMRERRLAGLPVTKNGKLVGIVTQKDLLESGAIMPTFESSKGRFRDSSKILSVMETNTLAVKLPVKIIKVAKLMVSKNIGRVPVIDEDGKLIGIVDREDVARLLIK
ncbi:CBS domain-containing protein [Candidatus Bathyarchaeota archaeon]|nr:CBS domain-containing protein [Candidatus Bathyarchaeota archaeon]